MGPSQGSISASPESASIAPDFGRGAGLCGSPASNAFYSSAQGYCFSSIFAHYCRYYGTFPLCGRCSYARPYYSVATVIMCANNVDDNIEKKWQELSPWRSLTISLEEVSRKLEIGTMLKHDVL
jgi:hypothetical protein